MRSKYIIYLLLIPFIAACSPETGSNLQKENKEPTPGGKYFLCYPESVTVKPGTVVDTIATQIPAFLGQVLYSGKGGGSECAKTDSVYKDDKIKIERIINKQLFKIEYCAEVFSPERIQLLFLPLEDPSFINGIASIIVSSE